MKEVQTSLCCAQASVEVHTSFLPVTPPAGLQQVTQGHPPLPGAPGLNFSGKHQLLLFTDVFDQDHSNSSFSSSQTSNRTP